MWDMVARYKVTLAMAGVCLFLCVVERIFPLRKRVRDWRGRWGVNLVLTAMVFVLGALVVRGTALYLAQWCEEKSIGLLSLLPIANSWKLFVGFLGMDLLFYYWHRANHEIKILWRFHAVHHVDPDLDVSTSFRFHFGEVLYSTGFRALQVVMLGIPPALYVTYEIVFQCATMFHHSNWRLPIRLERLLNQVIVTPRMHGIHHSTIQEETDSNYSVIFRFWDWLHRTLRLNVPQQEIHIGVTGYLEPKDNSIVSLLKMPFRKQGVRTIPELQVRPDISSRKRSVLRE